MSKPLTKEEFIEKAKKKHGDKYDYSEVVYVESHENVDIICPIHGRFPQTPNNHLDGKGCPKCKGRGFTSEERIEKCKIKHKNKYDYSKSDFSDVKEKTTIICPVHGEFPMSYDSHYNKKHGCPDCRKNKKLTQETFIKRLKNIFGDEYDTSNTKYINMHEPLTLICREHGEFSRTPIELLNFKRGCKHCATKNSPLEQQIKKLLEENKINFISQMINFDWLKTEKGGQQSLDFYLPEYKIAIECQGKQHFGMGGWSKSYSFSDQYELDKRKYKLCVENGIKLLYFSNKQPKYPYFNKVFTDKQELLNSIQYLYIND